MVGPLAELGSYYPRRTLGKVRARVVFGVLDTPAVSGRDVLAQIRRRSFPVLCHE